MPSLVIPALLALEALSRGTSPSMETKGRINGIWSPYGFGFSRRFSWREGIGGTRDAFAVFRVRGRKNKLGRKGGKGDGGPERPIILKKKRLDEACMELYPDYT
eukprot:229700-Amorphochlora_amoeboformis.AAC.3